jgi:hypothetical protein
VLLLLVLQVVLLVLVVVAGLKAAHRVRFFWIRAPESIGLLGPTESDSSVDSDSWVKKKSDSPVDSDSWVQTRSDSPVDSDSWVQRQSDSSLDSDLGTRARSDSGLDSGSWFGRAWGLAVGPPPRAPPAMPRVAGAACRFFCQLRRTNCKVLQLLGDSAVYMGCMPHLSPACRRRRLVGLEPQSRQYGTRA